MRSVAVSLVLALTAWMVVAIATAADDPGGSVPSPTLSDRAQRAPVASPVAPPPADPQKVPNAAAIRAAVAYADAREGVVSFAVINTEGKLRGRRVDRRYPAGSTVKAMLLAAETDRLESRGSPLDAGTRSLLEAMITVSDNDAADAIHARVGDPGMFAVADQAGMDRFTEAGDWGNAQVAASDLARFFSQLDGLMAGPHREYALGLLGSVVAEQSWGIPAIARPRWAVRFKGGWLPERGLVHQAAELRDGDRLISIAVLTDAQTSFEYGTETVRGVAERLLSRSGGA